MDKLDGVKAVREKLNADLIKLTADLANDKLDYEFTLNRISEIAKTLKRLPKDEEAKEEKTKKASKENISVFDAEANKSR